jgi:hypothetical protein
MGRSGASFGSFGAATKASDFGFGGVRATFTTTRPLANGHGAYNRQSSYLRWRRGYEIDSSLGIDNPFTYPFFYQFPEELYEGNDVERIPEIPGVMMGFPTSNKELGLHWTGARLAGAFRTDTMYGRDDESLSIEYVETTKEFFIVKLKGNWGSDNPLPPPLYLQTPNGDFFPLIGETFEDRIVEEGGELITRESIDPTTGLRYSYAKAVLAAVDPFSGILRFRVAGSIFITRDFVSVTPATSNFTPGRWLSSGSKYSCSCQDHVNKDYGWTSNILKEAQTGRSGQVKFPYTKPRNLKIGQAERISSNLSSYDLRAMTEVDENRLLEFEETRDLPGVFEDFGAIFLNNGVGPPTFNDYKTNSNGDVIYKSDYWTPQLDELRYCKHIYALKFAEGDPIPEPSDYPIGVSITELEQEMVKQKQRVSDKSIQLAEYGLAYMSLPPYNLQSPEVLPMVVKLFNLPSLYIRVDSMLIQDMKTGEFKAPT